MSTLLEKRQAASIKALQKRKAVAEKYIADHTAKLEEKLAPYRTEIELVEKMLDTHRQESPQLFDGGAALTTLSPEANGGSLA